MKVYIHLYNGKKIKKSPNLNGTFLLAGEIMRADYATVNEYSHTVFIYVYSCTV